MKILLNDQPEEAAEGIDLHALLSERGFATKTGIAVAVNASVVPVGEWKSCALSEGDAVLLIQATQGG